MKTLYLKILLIALFTTAINAQSDSINYLEDVSCSILKTDIFKDIDIDKMRSRSYLQYIEDLRSLTFKKDDLIVIKTGLDSLYKLNVNQLMELRKIRGNHIVPGIILGTIIGGLSGYTIGSSGSYMTPSNITVSALLGACAGGIIGYIIGSLAVSSETLNLFGLPDKNKKSEIIKFLKQKK